MKTAFLAALVLSASAATVAVMPCMTCDNKAETAALNTEAAAMTVGHQCAGCAHLALKLRKVDLLVAIQKTDCGDKKDCEVGAKAAAIWPSAKGKDGEACPPCEACPAGETTATQAGTLTAANTPRP